MADLKFDHAGSALPEPLPVAQSPDSIPLGSAGLVNQGSKSTVDAVAADYGASAAAAVNAALDKRESDWSQLSGGATWNPPSY